MVWPLRARWNLLLVKLVKREGVCSDRNGLAGSHFRDGHSDALLRVIDYLNVASENLESPLLSACELCELLLIVQVIDLHLHPVKLVARKRAYLASE